MQTQLADFIRDTPAGREADAILRACVHCGFCNATCPTYLLSGDELDGPRGRIYQIKQLLEGQVATGHTQLHLDRCLTCRNCETTCPSGVRYAQLLDIGREILAEQQPRPPGSRFLRWLLHQGLSRNRVFTPLLRLGQLTRPLLPSRLKAKIPLRVDPGRWPERPSSRKMLILEGCVQPAMTPETNAATARVLDRLGIQLLRPAGAGCCGALVHHLDATEAAKRLMRRNIDAWWPAMEQGAEAIVVTASGCGVMIKDYGRLLAADPAYATKARRVSALTRDLSEILAREDLSDLATQPACRVAFHPPCSLQHGQQLKGMVEAILRRLGHELVEVRESHLCCGSAGVYSILQGPISQRLLEQKLAALQAGEPEMILTANIGCQAHLATRAGVPVRHWISLLDPESTPSMAR